ncbi:dTDP-4-dehydrorhamnose reductase [Pleomorphomonas sp. JP5]|uniref:dTDP-4-dehydrorhamnose reductase n=1 Tax=Pleomorphomonas sp. JP5 TaxID=2942998 RepID=UPI00204317E9|nr:dTDP-4-dehydrorhamnose reductase [Pleomorphomonas sp. JP5]MCM5559394.1 dTDP-4-dehydrorhamnose reductase [Pleomorphomonas sp. JP5]
MTRRILVTGTEGQVVGSLVEKTAGRDDIELMLIGLPELDLTATDKIAPAIEALKPDVILSVAAYTAVDAAEGDEATALAVNGTAVGEIGKAAARLGVPVVHLSTDYVFSGDKPTPYVETDPTGPLSAYGRTKLAGELALAAATPNHAILRTAWVYSPFGKNFVKTMLHLGETRDSVGVVADQVGNPTSALDIADGLLKVADNLIASSDPTLRGTFHMTGHGETSWAGFAAEIFRLSAALGGKPVTVDPIPTSAYPTPAKRPGNSRLDCGKLERLHSVRLPDWRSSTDEVVRRLVAG